MSNIPSYLPVAQQLAATAPSQAVIPTPPPGLTQLSAGALIEGTVIGRTRQGLLAVKTSHGELALRTSASPPVQSRVVLQLQPSGGQFRVILLTSQAGPATQGSPTQNTAPSPNSQQAGSQPPASAPQARAAPPQVGSTPTAQSQVQVQSGATPRNAPPALPVPQSGAASQPGGQPASQPPTQTPARLQAGAGQQAGAALPATGRPAALPATLSTPAVLAAQTSAPTPTPGASPPATTPAPAPGTVQTATPASPASPAAPVTAGAQPATNPPATNPPATNPSVPSGAPAVATPGAPNAIIPTPPGVSPAIPAALGAQIGQALLSPGAPLANALGNPLPLPASALPTSVNPSPAGAIPPAGAALPAALSGVDLARIWPGLDQAVATLRAASPQVAAPSIDAVMPRAGPQLAGGLALLISALRGGDIRGWLGHGTMRELARSSGKEAASRLADDFGQLSRLARTDSGEWRVHALPFFDGARHQQIQLYLKHREESGSGDEDVPARFVFEFELSKLGPVQLDGLAANHRFDLVVRSQQDLPKVIRKEISTLFSRSQEESGFAGEIHFQTVPAFTVAPLNDMQPNAGDLMV